MDPLSRCSLRALHRLRSVALPGVGPRPPDTAAAAGPSCSVHRLTPSIVAGARTRAARVAASGERWLSGWGRRTVSPEAAAAAAKKKGEEAATRAAQAQAQKAEGDRLLQQARAKLAAGDVDSAKALKTRAAQEYKYGSIDHSAEIAAFDDALARAASAGQAEKEEQRVRVEAARRVEEAEAAERKAKEEQAAATAAEVRRLEE